MLAEPRAVTEDMLREEYRPHHLQARATVSAELPAAGQSAMTQLVSLAHHLPVDGIWGERDTIVPLSAGRDLIAATGGQLAIIPDAGHLGNLDAPGPFNRALPGLLDRQRAG